jgi:lysophospholipase L1-like esterase
MKPLAPYAAFFTSLLLCAPSISAAQNVTVPAVSSAQEFAIHDGDHVLFYGDSITEQRLYTTDLEEYVLTRFPNWKVQFTESGIGGDKVSGGWAGPVDLRLERDLIPYKPTIVTIMLGMNDGYYHPPEPAIQKSYENGYRYLVDTTLAAVPGVRLWLLGPSPYDDVTHPKMHYNEVMQSFSRFDQSEAERTHQGFADLNAPVVAVLEKARAAHPDLASDLIPDRVHPGEGVHWVMAKAVLEAWHAPSLVSSVALDARSGKTTDAKNATVTEIKRDKKSSSLEWTALEAALPLPLPSNTTDPVTNIALEASGIEQALDQETLTLAGLASGSYQLTIDGQPVGSFASDALAHGINLARLVTPMLRQSQTLAWDTDHRNNLERQLYRLAVGTSQHLDSAPAPEQQALQQAVATSIAQQQKDAQPVAHRFTLKPAQ